MHADFRLHNLIPKLTTAFPVYCADRHTFFKLDTGKGCTLARYPESNIRGKKILNSSTTFAHMSLDFSSCSLTSTTLKQFCT